MKFHYVWNQLVVWLLQRHPQKKYYNKITDAAEFPCKSFKFIDFLLLLMAKMEFSFFLDMFIKLIANIFIKFERNFTSDHAPFRTTYPTYCKEKLVHYHNLKQANKLEPVTSGYLSTMLGNNSVTTALSFGSSKPVDTMLK